MGERVLGTVRVSIWPGSSERILTLPGSWHEHLNVQTKKHDEVMIGAGNRQTAAEVVFTDESDVQMTETLLRELCLPPGPVAVKVVDGRLQFGPFVGVYALPSKQPGKPFGGLTTVFADMTELAAELGIILYVFTPGDAKWEEGYTHAYVYRAATREWRRIKRPLPDLVIHKIMGQPIEWYARMHQDQAGLLQIPYGLFSRAHGNKWNVHRTLVADSRTQPFLPDTRLIKTPHDILQMLERYGSVYVKPVMGTQGKSVYRLQRTDARVRVQYRHQGTAIARDYRPAGEEWSLFLKKRFCAKRKYLVQQSLDLIQSKNVSPVDFRWLIQKDGDNQWQITARVARVGSPSSITTNLHTGGDAVLADAFLRRHVAKSEQAVQQLLQTMDDAARAIALVLEEQVGRIGELGIDLGLTKQGEVRLIEVNPRPGRQMLKETSAETRTLSLRRNLEYVRYATGY